MHHLAEYQNAPIDPESAARLAASGLRLDTIDTSDAAAFEPWLQVEARGFHGARASAAEIEQLVEGLAYRRTTAVWDAASDADSADAEAPVATLNSWAAPMTVPGNSAVDTWLISGVSVSPTHRRRGIARALIEAELRTAVSLGVPVAALTVSEATIYDRFGFSPAVMSADWVIDTRRAKWAGPWHPEA
jgi:predicted N-acetyltransferase YhbS